MNTPTDGSGEDMLRRYRNARNGDIGPGGAGCQRWVSVLYALGASVDDTRRRRSGGTWGVGEDVPGRVGVVYCRGRFRIYYWPKPTGSPSGFEVNWNRSRRTLSMTLRGGRHV